MVSHANVLAVIDNMSDVPGMVESREDDILLLVLPLFHAYALNLAINRAFLSAMPFVLVTRFEAERAAMLMERHQVTMFTGAPPMYFGLVNTPGLEEVRRLSSPEERVLRRGAPSRRHPRTIQGTHRRRDLRGLRAERDGAHAVLECRWTREQARTRSAQPIPGVRDPPGRRARSGRSRAARSVSSSLAGRTFFAGTGSERPSPPKALRGGWFHTGDLARIDADGYYTIVDRKKDMILVSGYNVYPIEVENVLLRRRRFSTPP